MAMRAVSALEKKLEITTKKIKTAIKLTSFASLKRTLRFDRYLIYLFLNCWHNPHPFASF